MIDITAKIDTLRSAVAQARLYARPESLDKVMKGDTPKGPVLEMAKVSGILAAKKTPELIPYCHPLPLEHLEITFEREPEAIRILGTVRTVGPTGVEMEALTAVSVAALAIFDMMKGFDKEVMIGDIKVLEKHGGKSDLQESFPVPKQVAVLVTSDSVSSGKKTDRSGQIILDAMKRFPVEVKDYQVVPDEPEIIRAQLLSWIESGIELILTTGGTGLGPRDVTADVVREICDREIPGIAEAMRGYGQRRTPYAMLSRGMVGQKGKCLIFAMPGSSKGVEESLAAVFPSALHAFNMMRGGGH